VCVCVRIEQLGAHMMDFHEIWYLNISPNVPSPSEQCTCPRFLVFRRKATVSFIISVYVSVRMEQLGAHMMDFHEIWYLSISPKRVERIQVSFKSDKHNGYFTWSPVSHLF